MFAGGSPCLESLHYYHLPRAEVTRTNQNHVRTTHIYLHIHGPAYHSRTKHGSQPHATSYQLRATSYPSSTSYPEHHIPPATSYQLPVIHQLPRTPYPTFHHPPSTFHHPPSSIRPPSPLPLTTPVTYTHKTVHPTNPSLPTVHSSSIITHTTAAHLSRCCDARTTPARTWSLAR